MSDEELRVNRRLFLQQAGIATAMTGACYTIAMKTDAVAQQLLLAPVFLMGNNTVLPYQYSTPP